MGPHEEAPGSVSQEADGAREDVEKKPHRGFHEKEWVGQREQP